MGRRRRLEKEDEGGGGVFMEFEGRRTLGKRLPGWFELGTSADADLTRELFVGPTILKKA